MSGRAGPVVMQRVATLFQPRLKVDESRAAWLGGLLSGAMGGLAADLAAGGLTLGAGMLAGGLLGALGAAGAARGLNVVRGTHDSWVGLGTEALQPLLQATLLRYLAVAHFGRGRGDWADGEAPPHWADTVARVLEGHAAAFASAWAQAAAEPPAQQNAQARQAQQSLPSVQRLQSLLGLSTREVLQTLYPGPWGPPSEATSP